MASNNNTVVISFSIALFLLLILLLLITYSSKCQIDNVENFFSGPVDQNIQADQQVVQLPSVATTAQNSPGFSAEPAAGFYDEEEGVTASDPEAVVFDTVAEEEQVENVLEPSAPLGGIAQGIIEEEALNSNCYPRDRLTSDDLLPQGANSKWATVNPSGAGEITDQNFLQAGYHIGVNTVGQTLRNANLQLRHEPPNPQIPVSPWGISTIEPEGRMNGLLDIGTVP
tara:strand:- start:896 stop:1576 length:681 start_codon:yes stop_codon:yes gene_type:complete